MYMYMHICILYYIYMCIIYILYICIIYIYVLYIYMYYIYICILYIYVLYTYMYYIHICIIYIYVCLCVCVSVLCVFDSVILYDRIVVSLASMAVPRLSQSHGNRPVQGSFEEIKRGT